MTATRQQIDDFLALKRVAVVGVSRTPKEFSHALWQELRQRRYDAVPVNPATTMLDGHMCYPKVSAIQPPVDAVLILTPKHLTDEVMADCVAAGVKHVWIQQGMGGVGSVTKSAVAYGEEHGVEVIAGLCPYMFFPGTPFFHGFHAFGKKLTGSYPK